MKNLICILIFPVLWLGACQGNKESQNNHAHNHSGGKVDVESPSDLKKSIPMEAHGQVGSVHITITYHSPAVRARTIWGGLVPFGEVWVTGAHHATTVELSGAIRAGGTMVPEGKYAFFTIPGPEQWVIILNKNWDQHLADEYDEKDDVLRVTVTPETGLPFSERLVYSIENTGANAGKISMQWESLRVSLPFKTD